MKNAFDRSAAEGGGLEEKRSKGSFLGLGEHPGECFWDLLIWGLGGGKEGPLRVLSEMLTKRLSVSKQVLRKGVRKEILKEMFMSKNRTHSSYLFWKKKKRWWFSIKHSFKKDFCLDTDIQLASTWMGEILYLKFLKMKWAISKTSILLCFLILWQPDNLK